MKPPKGIKNYRKFYVATAIQKVFEVFYRFPDKEFSVNDLAKESGVAKTSLSEIIEELEKIGIIQIEKLSKIWRIKANRSNWHYIRGKIVYNLNFIYQSGIVEFLTQLYKNPKSIILFGSFRKGEDTSDSDIDIAIELEDIREYKTTGLRQLMEFEKAIGRNIQIHEFNRKVADLNVFNNITNGIVLYGFLEVKP